MAFSVNTNSGAFIALQNLSSTSNQLGVVQNRISTGQKVASAKDDAATFAIAQNLRADVGGLSAVKGSLDRAKSTIDVALSASESISDVLIQMKEKAVAASDNGMDLASRTALQRDFNALASQIVSYVNSASFNGTNLLKDAGQGLAAILDADASQTLTVANQGLNSTGGELATFMDTNANLNVVKNATWTAVTDTNVNGIVDGAEDAKASATAVDTALTAMNTVLSTLGSASKQMDGQLKFVSKLSDTMESGIGNLVDADLAKESAKLQSLQVKQQLGLQALSIANQAPQSVLGLFR
jgi:flagellin